MSRPVSILDAGVLDVVEHTGQVGISLSELADVLAGPKPPRGSVAHWRFVSRWTTQHWRGYESLSRLTAEGFTQRAPRSSPWDPPRWRAAGETEIATGRGAARASAWSDDV